jgi:hypothetical protein
MSPGACGAYLRSHAGPLQRLLGVIWDAFVLTYPEAIAVWILNAELGHAVEGNVQLGNR